jgi:transcription antitermination factor NusG
LIVFDFGVTERRDLEGEAMAVSGVSLAVPQNGSLASAVEEAAVEHWYSLHTRPRHEKIVAQRLQERGVSTYLPLVTEVHRWSDRKKSVQMPLFSCYVFAKFTPNRAERLRVLRVEGVFGLVGSGGEGSPIPEDQIDAVRNLVEGDIPWSSHPFLKIGQRVRICSGALNGLEGILVSRNGDRTLVISVDAIQRSLAVRVQGYEVEPV